MSLGEFETKVKQIQANAAERGKQGIENLETFAKNNIMKDLPQKKRKIVRQALGEAGVNIGDLTAGDMDKIAIAAKSGGKAKVIEVLNEIKARIKS